MKALAFGEVLWDVNGNEKTIGGAPLNVLAHIRKLGGESSIVSAVGSDELGRASLACLEDFGISEQYGLRYSRAVCQDISISHRTCRCRAGERYSVI